ncbi:MAG: MarR family transcriptional regulator, organic hydroperoxide resistance regulator [Miltoncostaeaceae bacterium]|nr:MarR family transcriptional regulator, organic hydroperoxide resistance regulator [Miltoncostaeaceae bacterium]
MTTAAEEGREAALTALALAWRDVLAAERRLRAHDSQRPDELSMAHLRALGALGEQEPLPAGRIAAAADLTAGSVTQMLDALEARGLVRRTRSDEDRRLVMVSLTDAGRERLEAKRREFRARWRDAMGHLSDEELAAGQLVMARLHALIEGYCRERAGRD